MAGVQRDLAGQYRRRAEEVRLQVETAKDESTRRRLLELADTWERMAAYEEEHREPPLVPPTEPAA